VDSLISSFLGALIRKNPPVRRVFGYLLIFFTATYVLPFVSGFRMDIMVCIEIINIF
jgi:hypothetical protein